MAGRASVVRTDFTGGAVSPRVFMRADAQGYRSLCAAIRNLIVRPQGGVHGRAGFKYRFGSVGGFGLYREIPFRRGGSDHDLNIVVDLSISGPSLVVRKNGVGVHTLPDTLPWTAAQMQEVEYAQTDRFMYLVHPDVEPYILEYVADDDWNLSPVDAEAVPRIRINDAGSPGTGTAVWRVTFESEWATKYGAGVQLKWSGRFADTVIRTQYPDGDIEYWKYEPYTETGATARMENRLTRHIEGARDLNPGDVSVTWVSGDTYDVVITGLYADQPLSLFQSVLGELGAPITEELTSAGSSSDEPAWSYPYVVSSDIPDFVAQEFDVGNDVGDVVDFASGPRFFRCIQNHVSDAVVTVPLTGTDWASYWVEVTQPEWYVDLYGSTTGNTWSAASVSYSTSGAATVYWDCTAAHTSGASTEPGIGAGYAAVWDYVGLAPARSFYDTWATATDYEIASERTFACIVSHTGVLATNAPVVGSSWATYWVESDPDGLPVTSGWAAVAYSADTGTGYFQCLDPHTSAAADEPAIGANWRDHWTYLDDSPPAWWDWQHGGSNAWVADTDYAPWGRGFPSVVTFYGQRAVLASTPSFPVTIWGSRVGLFSFFRESRASAQDTAAYSYTFDTKDAAALRWLTELQGLSAGTTAGNWQIPGAISPTDVPESARTTGRPSQKVRPVVVGPEVFHVEQGGTRIRRVQANNTVQGFLSTDFTLLAEHLTRAGIKRLAIQYVPETVLWGLRNDGVIIGCAYVQEAGIAAWFEVESSLSFTDMVSLYNVDTGQYEIHAIASNRVYSLAYEGDYCADDYQLTTGTGAGQVIAVSRLTGTVAVLERADADSPWADLGDFTVSGGNITVDTTAGYEVMVGKAFTQYLETLEDAGSGDWFPAARGWGGLWARLYDSYLPSINGEPGAESEVSGALEVGDYVAGESVRVNPSGYNRGVVTLQQDRPLRMEVSGVYGNLFVGND